MKTPVQLRRGFDQKAAFETILTNTTGIASTSTKQWERIEIHLPRLTAADYIACLMVKSKCTALPLGAPLDRKNSILYWHVDWIVQN